MIDKLILTNIVLCATGFISIIVLLEMEASENIVKAVTALTGVLVLAFPVLGIALIWS